MIDKTLAFGQRIYDWLSSFTNVYRGVLPSSVKPENVYIRIDGVCDYFGRTFIYPVKIYKQNTTSYLSVIQIAKQIGDTIGEGGLLLIYDNVRFKIEKGSPFYQDLADEDETTRAGYINLEITIY